MDKSRTLFLGDLIKKPLSGAISDQNLIAYRHRFTDDAAELSKRGITEIHEGFQLTADEKYNNLRNDSLLVELSCAEMGKDIFSGCPTVLCFASFAKAPGLGIYLGAVNMGRKLEYKEFIADRKIKNRLLKVSNSLASVYGVQELYSVDGLGLSKLPRPGVNFWETSINSDILSGLERRLVVNWRSRNSKRITIHDLEIFEIRPDGFVRPFPGYSEIRVRHDELTEIFRNQEANSEWRDKLSSVSGIYLVSHKERPELYVGSAYGENGIWGRWGFYAKNASGGSKELVSENLADRNFGKNCYWSMLETLPINTPSKEVIRIENLWKAKLGTRARGFGFNLN